MSVNIRRHPRGGWDVDITVLLATGDRHRERRKLNASYSKTTAKEWGERRSVSCCSPARRSERRYPHSKRLRRGSSKATRARTVRSRAASRPRRGSCGYI